MVTGLSNVPTVLVVEQRGKASAERPPFITATSIRMLLCSYLSGLHQCPNVASCSRIALLRILIGLVADDAW